MKYEEARKKPRVFQQLTGMTIEEFDKLKAAFQKACDDDEQRRGKPSSKAGRKAVLLTCEDKLFFILFYLRHYPTQEVLGFMFGISQGQANQWIHRLTPLVKDAVGDEEDVPGRTPDDVQEGMQACPEATFIIDGTERPIRRPQDSEARRQDYSGKKKRHTKKNIIRTEKATGEVLGLGATQPGSKHDKACVDEENYTFPEGSTVFQDTGFQGYAPEGASIQQPTKKPRGNELSPNRRSRTARSAPNGSPWSTPSVALRSFTLPPRFSAISKMASMTLSWRLFVACSTSSGVAATPSHPWMLPLRHPLPCSLDFQ